MEGAHQEVTQTLFFFFSLYPPFHCCFSYLPPSLSIFLHVLFIFSLLFIKFFYLILLLLFFPFHSPSFLPPPFLHSHPIPPIFNTACYGFVKGEMVIKSEKNWHLTPLAFLPTGRWNDADAHVGGTIVSKPGHPGWCFSLLRRQCAHQQLWAVLPKGWRTGQDIRQHLPRHWL